MSQNLYSLSLESIKFILGLIRDTVDLPTTILDDLNIATNTTYSSYRLDTLLKALKEENIEYCDSAIAGLNKLSKEIITDKSQITNENTIYLLLTDPVNNIYEQWLLINGTPQMIGTTEKKLDSVYTKDEADDLLNNKLDKPAVDGTAGQILVLQDDGSLAYEDNVGSGTTDLTNVRKVFCGLNELNTTKGLSISFTNGEDNTMKIVDALSPIETFADYFNNGIKDNRFGIDTNTYGTDISLLTITKFNDHIAIIRAFMANGKLLVRRYLKGVLEDWQYDKTDLSEINTKLTQLETKANLIPVVGDNPTDYDDLNNYKENGNYSIGDSSKYSNVPISRPGLLTVIRSNSYRLQIYTVVNNDDVYFRKSNNWGNSWSSWVLLNNSADLTDINDRLTQLENTTSGGNTNNDVYSTEEQAVGTWINGKTLYRRTIEDNTLWGTGTYSIPLFDYSTNMKIVKYEGVVTLINKHRATVIHSLPYSKDAEEVYVTKTTSDTLKLESNLTNLKLGYYIVSVYYYKI